MEIGERCQSSRGRGLDLLPPKPRHGENPGMKGDQRRPSARAEERSEMRQKLIFKALDIELHDETPPNQPDAPPDGPPDLKPLEHAVDTSSPAPEQAAAATWGLSPEGPEVE